MTYGNDLRQIEYVACGPAGMWYPEGIAVDSQGNVYVTDFKSHRILIWDAGIIGISSSAPVATTISGIAAVKRGDSLSIQDDTAVSGDLRLSGGFLQVEANTSVSAQALTVQTDNTDRRRKDHWRKLNHHSSP
jgi:DNA-binding beta-propeller fold protein YncE